MSIRLLQTIFLAGVLSPVDGSTLTLSPALEADLVSQGKAVWVSAPALPGNAGAWVTAVTDPVTREGSLVSAGKVVGKAIANPASLSNILQAPYRLACWGDSRANSNSATVSVDGSAAFFQSTRAMTWLAAYRGDADLVANYGVSGDPSSGWSGSRSQGKTITSLFEQSSAIDLVYVQYGVNDILSGNGTTPTAATIAGYLQALCLEIFRAGLPVLFESINPCMAVSTYNGVSSGWTSAGSGTSAQKQSICDAVNAAMKSFAAAYPSQMLYVDTAASLKDATGYASQTYYSDGTHLNEAGAMFVGKMLAIASYALLPKKKAMYFGDGPTTRPELISLLPGTTPTYFTTTSGGGTISLATPTTGFDSELGPYVDFVLTCSAITGATPVNITSTPTWASGVLSVQATAHGLLPGENVKLTGVTGSVDMSGPFSVASIVDANNFTVLLSGNPGTITNSSGTVVVQEATQLIELHANVGSVGGTATYLIADGDKLQGSAVVYADDGFGGTPILDRLVLRQRLFFNAGSPASVYADMGASTIYPKQPAFTAPFGPVRMETPKVISSNATGGSSANIYTPTIQKGYALHLFATMNAIGSCRIRMYSPSLRVVQPGPLIIATPASGSAYTNPYPFPLQVVMAPNGATVSAATVDRGDANKLYSLGTPFLTGGSVTLKPGDRITLTYSAGTPTLTGFV